MTPDLIIAFLTLTFLEIILGIDNIIFISILANRFPEDKQRRLIQIGLFLAMFMRIAMLTAISWLIQMTTALFSIDFGWFGSNISIQAIILLADGLFIIHKSTIEIFKKVENVKEEQLEKNLNITSYA